MGTPVLEITDGTDSVNLIGLSESGFGFLVKSWMPSLAQAKDGGVWQSSPFVDGRVLSMRKQSNVTDAITLSGTFRNQDEGIASLQQLRQLLEKAVSYWTTDWNSEPVWIVSSGPDETNVRYSLIVNYTTLNDPNPFSQPFYNCPTVALDELILTVEHVGWADGVPGSNSCVEVNEGGFRYDHLVYDGDTSILNCGSAASIDNLPNADFTAEAWIYANDAGEASLGRLFSKELANAGWYFGFNIGNFEIYAGYATSSYAEVKADHILDGEWHHIAAVFDVATKSFALYIDGVAPPIRIFRAGAGVYVGDAGQTLYIGNNSTSARGFDGKIGWCRLSSIKRYTAEFTPPSRCVYPVVDADTELQAHFSEGTGTAIRDFSSNAHTITASNTTWGDKECSGGIIEDDCDRVAWVSNQNTSAQITDIYVNDNSGGTWSANLAADGAYKYFPDPAQINDAIYFGISTAALTNSGPFFNLIFDIGTSGVGISNIWEYYNGAGWTAFHTTYHSVDLTELSTGAAFMDSGVKSIAWSQDNVNNWTTGNLNSIFGGSAPNITGWWVRCRVDVAPGAHTVPQQQNRRVYSVLWNDILIEADQVEGDLPAIARSIIAPSFSGRTREVSPRLDYTNHNRTIIGLRSLSRGEQFSSIIPLSDYQTPPGITIYVSGSMVGSFASSVWASTGRCVTYTSGAGGSWTVCRILFDEEISKQYIGTYRAFIRGTRIAGSEEDFKIFLEGAMYNTAGIEFADWASTKWAYPKVDYNTGALLDLGIISMPVFSSSIYGALSTNDTLISDDYSSTGILSIDMRGATGVVGFRFYDLILIPIDEWFADVYYPQYYAGDIDRVSSVAQQSLIDIDSITNPKRNIRAVGRRFNNPNVLGENFSVSTGGKFKLNVDTRQKLHFVVGSSADPGGYNGEWLSTYGAIFQAQLFKQQRYLSMRGKK